MALAQKMPAAVTHGGGHRLFSGMGALSGTPRENSDTKESKWFERIICSITG